MNPAKSARLDREANPTLYCPAPACLWKTSIGGPCQKHQRDIPLCGAFHPKRPILSCVMEHGHEGNHNTRYMSPWPQTEDAPV